MSSGSLMHSQRLVDDCFMCDGVTETVDSSVVDPVASSGNIGSTPAGGPGLVDTPRQSSPGLTAEQIQALQNARREGRKIARAAKVATFSGWTLATFAFVTLLSGLFSLPALLLGIAMAVAARIELTGAKGLRRLEPTAARRLGLNQIALAGMLCLYGSWGIFQAATGPGAYDEQIAAGGEMADMLEPIAQLNLMLALAIYGAVIVGGLVGPGCASLYYFTRRAHIDAHLRRTPQWVVKTLRAVN